MKKFLAIFMSLSLCLAAIPLGNVAQVNAADSEQQETTADHNSIQTAQAISLNVPLKGSISSTEEKDYYKFTLPSEGHIAISFNNTFPGFPFSFQLYGGNDNQPISESALCESHPVGTYYIMVSSRNTEDIQNYEIKVTYTPSTEWETESNDTFNTAQSLSIDQIIYGWAGGSDTDYFKFSVTDSGYYCLNFPQGNFSTATIFSSDQKTNLQKSQITGMHIDDYTYTDPILLSAGTYYIRVQSSSYTQYSFKIVKAQNRWVNGYYGGWSYQHADGTPFTKNDWETIDGKRYYFDDHSCRVTGQQEIDGKTYFFNEDGVMITGWKDKQYFNSDGAMATGWTDINGKKYYFNNDGTAKLGWQYIDGKIYRFIDDGAATIGWADVDGKKYYFNSDGAMVYGQQVIDGKTYYFNLDGTLSADYPMNNNNQGEAKPSTQQSSQTGINNSNLKLIGWQYINGNWYYFNANGTKTTGWQFVNGSWYYMNESGTMLTGWQFVNGNWYYMNGSGAMLTGWQFINGCWYYLNDSGAMLTDWQLINGHWYYMNGSGAMLTGWQVINGQWYYLTSSGAMAYSEYYGGYWLNSDGTWTYPYKASWYRNASGWWYGDASGWYASNGYYWIDGTPYGFNGAGYWN